METTRTSSSGVHLVATLIVRDEAHVLERCLRSLMPVVRAFCIVDTGSIDGTAELAEEVLAGCHGVVERRPWVDFATNRTEALALARGWGTHALVIDADDVVVVDAEPEQILRQVTADVHPVRIRHGGDDGRVFEYHRPLVVSTRTPMAYRGVLHEFLDVPSDVSIGPVLPGLHVRYGGDGARSRAVDKFERDALTLERALAERVDPDLRPRYTMYLGSSWRDAGRPWRALVAYEDRIGLGGWIQEVYCALLYAGDIRASLGRPAAEVLEAYRRAEELVPLRAEAPFRLGCALRSLGRVGEAVAALRRAAVAFAPAESLFVEADVYEWRATAELVNTVKLLGDDEETARVRQELENSGRATPDVLHELGSRQ